MNNLIFNFIAIVILFSGEALSIYSEMIAAKTHTISNLQFIEVFLKGFFIIACAGGFLIAGYMIGFKSFKNIWMVSALSITSILIMEPLIGYLIFQQLPTRGALIGLILGATGFVATFVVK